MYGCESWTIMKAEHQRIDAFKLWCWRRLLRVPWTERISNQSILKEINPEYPLEGWCWSSNNLATWCKELNHWKRQQEKGMTENEMVGWHHGLKGHEFEQALGIGDGQRSLACCSPQGCKELDTTEVHVISLISFLWLWFSFCLPSDREGQEAYGSFLMGETDCVGNWVLFWWVGPCSVNL